MINENDVICVLSHVGPSLILVSATARCGVSSHLGRGAISEGAAPCPYWLAPCPIYTRPARKKLICNFVYFYKM